MVEQQLREILADILSQTDSSPIQSADEIESTRKLSELGINSVDLMEFVLRAEQQINVDLLSNLTPDALPETILAWADFVQDQKKNA